MSSSQNPYESPRAPLGPARRRWTQFHEWLVDRMTLIFSSCLIFMIVWGAAMLVTFTFGAWSFRER